MLFRKIHHLKEIIVLTSTLGIFVLAVWLTRIYHDSLQEFILDQGMYTEFVYILISMAAIFIAPVSSLPLLPVAVAAWGPFWAAIFTTIGWTAGAGLVFMLSRILGKRVLRRWVDIERIKKWSEAIPKKNLFWLVVFSRFALPVDIISYGLGLFSKMHWASYIFASFVGIAPFVFLVSYGLELPIYAQIVIGAALLTIIFYSYKHNFKKKFIFFK